ncbi:MAG TPA: deoxynucleoside kinase [Anaerolineaceae bacterium]|mgnify:CR=1 FL=1|nr:deoxynucleoside kinase [Anaerolineaceae bacterium]HPN51516.1 deoxynucleoside kinase [Anaerolineaceae bacterium]
MKKYIVIAGNIGVGKSTLAELLSARLGFEPFYEPVANNPYLADFYSDMPAWAFHSQIYFLSHRLRTQRQLMSHPGSIIQDRSVFEDAEIFAANLHRQGHLSQRDFDTYTNLYQTLIEFLPPPDLVIYLRASTPTLQHRIALRSRDYERSISPAYLEQLNMLYEDWIRRFTLCPVLTIPADDIDFVAQPRHLELVVRKVQEKLTGKDEVSFTAEEMNGAHP